MQDASQLATAHYPETLDRIFVSEEYVSSHLGPNRILLDPRCTCFLSYRMGLDQTMV